MSTIRTNALESTDELFKVPTKSVARREATIASMVDILAPTDGMSVEVTESGRAGLFVFDSSLTGAADNGTTFKATDATAGSWMRQFSGAADLRWFGAVVGSDSTAALLAAVNSGFAIAIVGGEYLVDTIAPAGDIHFVGDGSGTLKHTNNAANHMIRVATGKSVKARGVNFDGNTANQATDRDIFQGAALNGEFKDCLFSNSSNRAIGLSATKTLHAVGCTFRDCDNYPIQVFSGNFTCDFIVTGCVFTYDATKTPAGENVRAIQPGECRSVTISGNYIDGGRKYRDGIWMARCDGASITGNTILETADDQITVGADCDDVSITGNTLGGSDVTGGIVFLAGTTTHKNVVVSGNTIFDGVIGVYLINCRNIVIANNAIRGVQEGVRIINSGTIEDVVIDGNRISEVSLFGIDCGAGQRIAITDNNITGTGAAETLGVHGRSSTDVSVDGNRISGFEMLVQTSKGHWSVSDNWLSEDGLYGIQIGAGTSGDLKSIAICGNEFVDIDAPFNVVTGRAVANMVINGNRFIRTGAAAGTAVQLVDAVDAVVSNNRMSGYTLPFASGAGSNRVTYVGNISTGCTNPPSFASLTIYVAEANIPIPDP